MKYAEARAQFRSKYQGPWGRHLSNVTMTSMVGQYDPEKQESIHPRVVGGRTVFPKKNTMKHTQAS